MLLSSDQTDSSVSIDMDSVRRQQQLQVIEQQVGMMQLPSLISENSNLFAQHHRIQLHILCTWLPICVDSNHACPQLYPVAISFLTSFLRYVQ